MPARSASPATDQRCAAHDFLTASACGAPIGGRPDGQLDGHWQEVAAPAAAQHVPAQLLWPHRPQTGTARHQNRTVVSPFGWPVGGLVDRPTRTAFGRVLLDLLLLSTTLRCASAFGHSSAFR